MPGRVLEVGDHEARVVLGLTPAMADDLGLDDDAAALFPGAGGIASLAIQMRGLTRFARQPPGDAHEARSATREHHVLPIATTYSRFSRSRKAKISGAA